MCAALKARNGALGSASVGYHQGLGFLHHEAMLPDIVNYVSLEKAHEAKRLCAGGKPVSSDERRPHRTRHVDSTKVKMKANKCSRLNKALATSRG